MKLYVLFDRISGKYSAVIEAVNFASFQRIIHDALDKQESLKNHIDDYQYFYVGELVENGDSANFTFEPARGELRDLIGGDDNA